jgi:MoaA/NifB/PqqE/SkfB family radical SAM enzyme
MKIIEKDGCKELHSEDYNYIFRRSDGSFWRWGETEDDDPQFSPYGPEILDLEISSGKCNGRCKFCYKDNGEDENTHHMTLEEFKTVFHKIPNVLTQIAFGICDISSNPDFFAMMEYSREHRVIPNYTCNGLEVTQEIAQRTAKLCGAVAVSLVNKKKSYEAINNFLDAGMKQVNMHYMLSEETYDKAFEVIDEIAKDLKPKGFNAIVFLQYKPKGKNADSFHSVLSVEKYTKLIKYCDEKEVNYGFDSCSANIFIESIPSTVRKFKIFENAPREAKEYFEHIRNRRIRDLMEMAEPCESGLFSSYINCYGKFFVCSFAEGEDVWQEGLDVLNCDDFLNDIWNHPRLIKWRDRLIKNERDCPIYELALQKV